MVGPYFCGPTLDDVMRFVIERILSHGDQIHPTKGLATELAGVLLEITKPRARLSRTETRGKPFSCLGELCWYLAGVNDLKFIAYYIPAYREYAEGNVIFGGYGPRLFGYRDQNQVDNVINLLRGKPDSRQAVIQLFDAGDIVGAHKDIPCTCTLQFMIRHNALHMITYMRSNDAFLGLPHDIFSFTMLQEIVARALFVELGTYKHTVGSLHLYDGDRDMAQQFLCEGWQSTKMQMPPMPLGDPWLAIQSLLEAETAIRNNDPFDSAALDDLDPYWADLIRLLQVFRCSKNNDTNGIEELRRSMSSLIYHTFIDNRLNECQKRSGRQPLTG
jgi:thymidylate synthase